MSPAPIRVAPASPSGEAALHVLRLAGEDVRPLLDRIFRTKGGSRLLPADLRFGDVIDDDGKVLDQAVVRISDDAGAADLVIHGGAYLRARTLARLERAGAVVDATDAAVPVAGVERGATVSREAAAALADAYTDGQLRFFLDAAAGWWATTAIEAASTARYDRGAAEAALDGLLAGRERGFAFARPPSVMLYGPVNAGKSTLFNALLGEERTLVSAEPGVTRDVVDEAWSCFGLPFRLIDAAGLRDADHAVEREGVARARRAAAEAEVRVLVFDGSSAPPAGFDAEGLAPACLVLTHADLAEHPAASDAAREFGAPVVRCCAPRGDGLPELRNLVLQASPFQTRDAAARPAPFTARQVAGLKALRESLAGDSEPALTELLDGRP